MITRKYKNSSEILLDELTKLQKKLQREHDKLEKEIFHSPYKGYLKIHQEFNGFLKNTKGKDRLNKCSIDKINKLSAKEKKAKIAMDNFHNQDVSQDIDYQVQLKGAMSQLANIIFTLNIRKK